jgi:hypothetical protein
MAVLQGGAARRLGAAGAERAARGALALTPVSFICVALAAVPRPPLASALVWLWLGLVLFALCKYTPLLICIVSNNGSAAMRRRASRLRGSIAHAGVSPGVGYTRRVWWWLRLAGRNM